MACVGALLDVGLLDSALHTTVEEWDQELLSERVRGSVVEPGTVETEPACHLDEISRDATRRHVAGTEALRPEDIADAIGYIVTRERRVAVNQMLVRAGCQAW